MKILPKPKIFKNASELKDVEGFSYSRLAKVSTNIRGFLTEDKKTDAFRRGDLVDLLYESSEDSLQQIENNYLVTSDDMQIPGEAIIKCLTFVLENGGSTTKYECEINEDLVLAYAESINYGKGKYNNETIFKKLLPPSAEDYYFHLVKSKDKTVVTSEEYHKAVEIVNTFKTHPFTKPYCDSVTLEEEGWERYHQVAFAFSYEGYTYKGILDEMQVNKKLKRVRGIDIKTTSMSLKSFYKSFYDYRYDIQSSLYKEFLERAFPEYDVDPFVFVYGSYTDRENALVYDASNYQTLAKLGYVRNNRTYKGWLELAKELEWHYENDMFLFNKEIYDANGVIKLD
jgi:hypothetical protein